MKFDKVNQDVLKRLIKEKDVTYGTGKDNVWFYILSEGNCAVYAVHKNDWYINLFDVQKPNVKRLDNLGRHIQDMMDAATKELKDTGDMQCLDYKKKLYAKALTDETGQKVWVNPKLLEYFDTVNARYFGTDAESPVVVLEGSVFAGVLMPINIRNRR